jgi:HK97 gp10 family phage protein
MIELTFDQLIAHLETIQTEIAGAQQDALEVAAAELVEHVKANLPDNETGDIIRDHLRASIDGDVVTVGVVDALVEIPGRKELFDVGQAAEDLEFGTVNSPPQSYLAAAMFQHGEVVSMGIAADVGRVLAGFPPRRRE